MDPEQNQKIPFEDPTELPQNITGTGAGANPAPVVLSSSNIVLTPPPKTGGTAAVIALFLSALGLIGWLLPIAGFILSISGATIAIKTIKQNGRSLLPGITLFIAAVVMGLSVFALISNHSRIAKIA